MLRICLVRVNRHELGDSHYILVLLYQKLLRKDYKIDSCMFYQFKVPELPKPVMLKCCYNNKMPPDSQIFSL